MSRDMLLQNSRFLEFVRSVQTQLDQLHPETPYRAAALQSEQQNLEEQLRGWIQSLGNASLPAAVRTALEAQFEQAEARINTIEAELSEATARSQIKRDAVNPGLVADYLERMDEILASENASATNVMLSQHIDGIYCDEDGTVIIRTCKLGALAGALDLLPRDQTKLPLPGASGNLPSENHIGNPRRRAKLNVGAAIEDDDLAETLNDFAVDPNRFAGLGPEWFTEDVFQVPRRLSWAEAHAQEVADFRRHQYASMAATAKHFGKTIPTIRESLRYAKKMLGIDAFGKTISKPTRPHWAKSNASAVAEFFRQPGVTMKMAIAHFGKTEPTIRCAREFARDQAIQSSVEDLPTDANPHDGQSDDRLDSDE